MTSISSVNAGSTAATEVATQKSTLSNSTKNELEALGITATDGMTEAEAQEKIAQAQQEENAENGDEQQGNSNESEILADAKTLAALEIQAKHLGYGMTVENSVEPQTTTYTYSITDSTTGKTQQKDVKTTTSTQKILDDLRAHSGKK